MKDLELVFPNTALSPNQKIVIIICLCQINQSDCKNSSPYIAYGLANCRTEHGIRIGKTFEKDRKKLIKAKVTEIFSKF